MSSIVKVFLIYRGYYYSKTNDFQGIGIEPMSCSTIRKIKYREKVVYIEWNFEFIAFDVVELVFYNGFCVLMFVWHTKNFSIL